MAVLVIFSCLISSCIQKRTGLTNQKYEVGDVVFSLLEPSQFLNTNHSGTWLELDGSLIPEDSRLRSLIPDTVSTVPDARGKFIRISNAKNDNKEEGSDPQLNRKIGSIQGQDYLKHNHNTPNSGLAFKNNKTTRIDADNKGNEINIDHYFPMKDMPEKGGVETRPINVTLYAYIKISND